MAAPQASQIPVNLEATVASSEVHKDPETSSNANTGGDSGAERSRLEEGSWPYPKFALRIDDLSHPGAAIFLRFGNVIQGLKEAALMSFTWLYTPETVPTNVKSILLVLRPMDGVAYCTGTDEAKEIHLSLDYVNKVAHRAADEIRGVLVHETVHCYQHNAKDTCPGGLIEGVADYVRLRAGYAPPHWKKTGGGKWDAGYDKTGYFLAWIEESVGEGTIKKLNLALHGTEYEEKVFQEVTGQKIGHLWKAYCASLEGSTRMMIP